MNKEWSEMNKQMQTLLGKESTYKNGIAKLIELRAELMKQISSIVNGYPAEAFYQMPFAGADGYHSKTLAYSIWHIFRIEDITMHCLIMNDEQVFFSEGFDRAIGSDIITTGNELQGGDIAEFSKKLNVSALFDYANRVMISTDNILLRLDYSQLKRKFTVEDKQRLINSGCVSSDPNAVWLIDYWCGKDIRGLIKMPFSRHWIMHIEAMQRIKNKLCKIARKGVDPIAYCGFSCNHCFLGQWCGSCRTEYNACSFAVCFPDKKCPNVTCCKEKGCDGCYDCAELEACGKGFYIPSNDGANAAKAQAMFIKKYGKKAFIRVHDLLHEKNDFAKTQEILGQDMYKGLEILEKVYYNCENNKTIIAMDCLCVDVYEASNEMCAGGEALNFAAVASQYDADIKLLGAVGNDRFGAAVVESIKNKRICRELIHIVDGAQTAHHIISLTENGDRYFKDGAWHGGIHDTYKLTDADKQAILAADYVFTTYSSPNFDTLLNLRRQGAFRLAVDFNDIRQLDIPDSTLKYIDIFFISGEEKILPKLKEWSEKYDNIFNATLAENGSVTYFKGKEYRVSAVPVDKVIDTTGCGDSYHAGFLCTYLKTADIIQAMNEGSRSAAHTLSHYGGFD